MHKQYTSAPRPPPILVPSERCHQTEAQTSLAFVSRQELLAPPTPVTCAFATQKKNGEKK